MHPNKKYEKCDRCSNRVLRRTAYCILHCKNFSKYEPREQSKQYFGLLNKNSKYALDQVAQQMAEDGIIVLPTGIKQGS